MKPEGQLPFMLVMPVQSVETPLQTLGCGCTSPWHTTAPLTQAVVPGLHGGAAPVAGNMVPGSGTSGVQGEPPTTPTRGSIRLSSIMPLQLSSMPLQISGLGPTVCTQVSPFGPEPGLGATH